MMYLKHSMRVRNCLALVIRICQKRSHKILIILPYYNILLQSGTVLLQNGTAFWYYKVRRGLLQSGTALFITKWDNFIIKRDRYYKVGRLLQSEL